MLQFSLAKSILKTIMLGSLLGFLLFPTSSFADENDKILIETIKKQLINDPDFILSLSDTLVKNPQLMEKIIKSNESEIRSIIKAYLLEEPEILFEVQSAFEEKQSKELASLQKQVITKNADQIFNSSEDAVFGNPKGTITIVEFYDYNCGYCKQSFPDMMNLIKSNDNIRFIMKDLPILGQDSVKTHSVAHAFQQMMPEKYMEFHQKLLLENGRATEEKAIDVALSLGADEKKLRELIKDERLQQSILKNVKLAYDLGITGTPSYIVGDEVLVGAVGKNALLEAIQDMKN